MKRSILAFFIIASLLTCTEVRADDFWSTKGKELLELAASMPASELGAVDPAPKERPLTQVLLSIPITRDYLDDSHRLSEFRIQDDIPPSGDKLTSGLLLPGTKRASLLKRDNIRRVVTIGNKNYAEGIVEFGVEGVFSGKMGFVAHNSQGAWKIEEFRLPANGKRIVLKDEGTWVSLDWDPARDQ